MFVGIIHIKPSRDFTCPLGIPRGLKDLLHMLNVIVSPTKEDVIAFILFLVLFCYGTSKMEVWGYLIRAKYCIFEPLNLH
jgi:hypothetical protein